MQKFFVLALATAAFVRPVAAQAPATSEVVVSEANVGNPMATFTLVPPRAEPLSAVEEQALARLDRANATVYQPITPSKAAQPGLPYDFGPSDVQPGTLYRVRGGGEVMSSIPGLPGYGSRRVVLEVELLPASGVAPDTLRSHLLILQLIRLGHARLIGTGVVLHAPVVPDGSTLEGDASRPLHAGWYRGRPVHYFDFGPTRREMASVSRAARPRPTPRQESKAASVAPTNGLAPVSAPASERPIAANAVALATSPSAESVVRTEAGEGMGGRIFSGRANRLKVDLPRIDITQDIRIDGNLDEPVWQGASLLTGFSEYQPQDGRPAEDSTEVYVWYAQNAIYFGVRAFEPHGAVRANHADRDKISSDDQIQIYLDTFNDRRRALVFMVNPYGSQADGTRTESGAGGGTNDLDEDFQYQSKGRVTDYGYEVEVRIPFKSLRYQTAEVQDWGINVLREVQHSQHEQSWAPLKKGNASMLVQSGKLTGVKDIKRGLVLDLNPTVTSRVTGTPIPVASGGGWDYASPKPEFGGNARWGITTNLTMNATANPDFSQVEADVQQNQFDPRSAVSFPEKRPFFVEGSEQFDAPNNLIYTRAIGQPVAALKLNGKVSGTSIGLLSAVDDKPFSLKAVKGPTGEFTGPNAVYNILRLKRDFGAQSTAGLVYSDRVDGGFYNRVVGVDARYVFSKVWYAFAQFAQSFDSAATTPTATGKARGSLWQIQVDRTGKYYGNDFNLKAISTNFRTRSGFISRANQVTANIAHRFTFFGKRGSALESYTFTGSVSGNWRYDQFLHGDRADTILGITSNRLPNDPKLHLNNSFNLKGGWRVNANYFLESFHYDRQLYGNYYIERTLSPGVKDTVPYVGVNRITNHDYSLSVTTPQFKTFKFTFNVIGGWDENFEEWAQAQVFFPTATLDWFPTSKIRVNARYPLSLYVRMTDWSTVKRRQIPRLKVEYQASHAIFFRFVGQYDAQFRDSLRDDSRTEFPILIRNPSTGRFTRAGLTTKNDFRVDWLFSYQPHPGTVFFAGYGASLTEPEAFRFGNLNRTTDGFFVKLSYLYRL